MLLSFLHKTLGVCINRADIPAKLNSQYSTQTVSTMMIMVTISSAPVLLHKALGVCINRTDIPAKLNSQHSTQTVSAMMIVMTVSSAPIRLHKALGVCINRTDIPARLLLTGNPTSAQPMPSSAGEFHKTIHFTDENNSFN